MSMCNCSKSIQAPLFTIFTGPMFGGKTTSMLSRLERARRQKKKIILFKPKRDNRYTFDKVISHTGFSWNAHNVSSGEEILNLAEKSEIVAVDEAFMIPGSAEALITLFRRGKTIFVSSIQLSAKGEPFEEIQKMFPWATSVIVCPAVCPVSNLDAYYTIAKDQELENIHVGGEDLYEPRSYYYSNIMSQESNQLKMQSKFKVGDKAHKPKGYKFPCTIVSVFQTLEGNIRVVGEMDEFGLLHIFNEEQLKHYNEK